MKGKWKQSMAAAGFLLPSLAGVTVFYLLPLADVVRRSFTTAVTGEFTGFDNYRTVFQNEAFLLAAKNTAKFALCCLPILIVSGLLVALLITGSASRKGFQTCYLLPMAVPAATVALVWQIIFDRSGLLNGALSGIASALSGKKTVVSIDYMETDAAFWVLVASYVWKNLGYTVTLWAAGLLGIPYQLKEAARVDGAGRGQIFFKIVLPQLKPTLYTITVLSFLNSFKAFREVYLAAGSYPHESIYLLQHLFNNWYVDLALDKMAAAAVVTGAVLLLAILVW
ncbi:MAG: carbohydrate ABC transporter permease [Eisenbergiella sp.]